MNKNIAVIDDDETILYTLDQILSRYGLNVSLYLHPQTFIKKADISNVDILLMDRNYNDSMSESSDWIKDIITQIKKTNNDIRIALMTGNILRSKQKIMDSDIYTPSIDAYIQKTVKNDTLIECIKKLLYNFNKEEIEYGFLFVQR